MLVLDSATIPVRDRLDMVVESVSGAALATTFVSECPEDQVRLTMNAWPLGVVELFDTECSAHTLRRKRGAPDDEPPSLFITHGLRGAGVHSHLGRDLDVGPSGLWATDATAPYIHRIDHTRTITAKVAIAALGLPHDLVRQALEHLGKSPLTPLFTGHVREVCRVANLVDGAAAVALGAATLTLARAVVASVADDDRLGRELLEDTLLPRIKAFVRRHLGDPALDADAIAAAHHVSVRHLYKVCAQADLRLEQWIIRERLTRAADDLSRLAPAPGVVATVSRRWGFVTPSHFAHRFRAAYGVSPREWQSLHTAGR